MFSGTRLLELVIMEGINLSTYHHCLAKIICDLPFLVFYLGECDFCPSVSQLRGYIAALLDDNLIDNITIKQWVSVESSTPETYTKPVDLYCEKLKPVHTPLYHLSKRLTTSIAYQVELPENC